MSSQISSGVFPCYENQFKVNTGTVSTPVWSTIADCETFEVSLDNNVEEWTPFEQGGWVRRLVTGKGVTLTVTAKRNIGDTGNDFIAGLTFANGRDAEAGFQWNMPDGTVVEFADAVIGVTNNGGGDATNVGALEFTVQSNGKPTISVGS